MMFIASLSAVALVSGLPVGAVIIGAAAVVQPITFLCGVAAWAGYSRWRLPGRPGADQEAAFLRGVAAEVRAGASLRNAIVDGASRSELDLGGAARLAGLGRPMAEVGTAMASALRVNGRVAGPAVSLAAEAGAQVGGLFESLAHAAAVSADEARERRVATAQARLSAWLVAGVPATAATVMAVTTGTFSSGAGIGIAAIGFVLLVAGSGTVLLMLRKAGS